MEEIVRYERINNVEEGVQHSRVVAKKDSNVTTGIDCSRD